MRGGCVILLFVLLFLPFALMAQPISPDGTLSSTANNGEIGTPVLKADDSPRVTYFLIDQFDRGTLKNLQDALMALQNQAENDKQSPILIVEIVGGPATFGQVLDLAKSLTSTRYSKVRTVAWVPALGGGRALDGYAAILPLACREIVMHPDAVTGDIGHGQPLEDDEQQVVINIVEKRYNTRVNGALAAGMCDPQAAVLLVKLDLGRKVEETRLVTGKELRRLQDSNVAIPKIVTIKKEGMPLLLSGREAHKHGVLTMHIAQDRTELANIYGFNPRELRPDGTENEGPRACLIRIAGPIDERLKDLVTREIQRATAEDANLIFFEIDSPGGELFASESIAMAIAEIDPKSCRSIAYVPKQAISGGAMIALGCDEIIMHPDARIGDMFPAAAQPGWPERLPEKVLSIIREMLRELAERKGRPPALLRAMVDKDLVVYEVTHRQTGRVSYLSTQELEAVPDEWNQGAAVADTRKGVALTLSGQRAYELNLAAQPVRNFDELKLRFGIPTEQVLAGQRPFDPEPAKQPVRNPEEQASKAAPRTWVNSAAVLVLVAIISGGIMYYIGRRARQ
jgi:membrane-bound serine protease (ClpP class)